MKRRMLTTVLAVLLALIGTGGVLLYVHGADTRALAGERAVSTLVAAQAIPAGTSASAALRQGMLVSQKLPASSVPADAVAAITPELGGLVMSAAIQPGQLLLRSMLVTQAQVAGAGVLAIPNGMVAVTIPMCMSAAVAGYVQPGSDVAVFDTYGPRNLQVSQSCSGFSQIQAQANGAHLRILTRVVLPRVLVLSVGTAPTKGSSSSTALGSSSTSSTSTQVMVTMAVSQADAERLILLTQAGLPYMALLTPSSRVGYDAGPQPPSAS